MALRFEIGGRTFLHDGNGWTDEHRETVGTAHGEKLNSALTQLLGSSSSDTAREEAEMDETIDRMIGGMMSMCADLDPFHVVDPPSFREDFIVYLEGLGSGLEEALNHLADASESFVLAEELLEADVVVLW